MKVGNPINSLSNALSFYTLHTGKSLGLDGEVYLFPQTWGSTALGFGGIGCQAITTADTTVIIERDYLAWVFFAGEFAYKCLVNEIFRQNLKDNCIKSVKNAEGLYEGLIKIA